MARKILQIESILTDFLSHEPRDYINGSSRSPRSGDRDDPYIFTKFHAVANFVESQHLAEPKYEITGETLKFMAAGEIF